MSVPAYRNSRSRVRRRRAHHALKTTGTSSCPKCEAPVLGHRACLTCGYYNGRQVIVKNAPTPTPEKKNAEKQVKSEEKNAPKDEKKAEAKDTSTKEEK